MKSCSPFQPSFGQSRNFTDLSAQKVYFHQCVFLPVSLRNNLTANRRTGCQEWFLVVYVTQDNIAILPTTYTGTLQCWWEYCEGYQARLNCLSTQDETYPPSAILCHLQCEWMFGRRQVSNPLLAHHVIWMGCNLPIFALTKSEHLIIVWSSKQVAFITYPSTPLRKIGRTDMKKGEEKWSRALLVKVWSLNPGPPDGGSDLLMTTRPRDGYQDVFIGLWLCDSWRDHVIPHTVSKDLNHSFLLHL